MEVILYFLKLFWLLNYQNAKFSKSLPQILLNCRIKFVEKHRKGTYRILSPFYVRCLNEFSFCEFFGVYLISLFTGETQFSKKQFFTSQRARNNEIRHDRGIISTIQPRAVA